MARLRAAGSPIGTPVDGSRVRPDGEIVRWRTAAADLGPCEPPFLIEHAYEGAEWDDPARAARAAFRHPAGGTIRLTRLELPCAGSGTAAAAWARAVGLRFEPSADGSRGTRRPAGPPAHGCSRCASDRRSRGNLAGVHGGRGPRDPVAMRQLAILALAAALAAGGCGATTQVVEPPSAPEPTPVAGASGGGPVPAMNPDRVDPVVQIAEGVVPSGPWRAWAYRLKDGSMCIEYAGIAHDGAGGASCGPESSVMNTTTSVSERDAFISGERRNRRPRGSSFGSATARTSGWRSSAPAPSAPSVPATGSPRCRWVRNRSPPTSSTTQAMSSRRPRSRPGSSPRPQPRGSSMKRRPPVESTMR